MDEELDIKVARLEGRVDTLDNKTHGIVPEQCIKEKEKTSHIESRLSCIDAKLVDCAETKTTVTKLVENLGSMNEKLASICKIASWAGMTVGALLITALIKLILK